jgi:hypothetical protein
LNRKTRRAAGEIKSLACGSPGFFFQKDCSSLQFKKNVLTPTAFFGESFGLAIYFG